MHISKNHDFIGEVPILAGQAYLVQYREFVPSLVSHFELIKSRWFDDSFAEFEKFAVAQACSYNLFMKKWIAASADDTVFARISYERLMQSTFETMTVVVKLFLSKGECVDQTKLRLAIAGASLASKNRDLGSVDAELGVRSTRDIHLFKHYQEDFFEKLREETNDVYQKMRALPETARCRSVGPAWLIPGQVTLSGQFPKGRQQRLAVLGVVFKAILRHPGQIGLLDRGFDRDVAARIGAGRYGGISYSLLKGSIRACRYVVSRVWVLSRLGRGLRGGLSLTARSKGEVP